ncbi:MAG: LAGLIDADG family homing endonuclease [Candidatus Lokiarchaeia archaeon]
MTKQSNNKNPKHSKIQLEENEDLAEFISVILGDGGIYVPPIYNSYTLTISLNGIDEKLYVDYVKRLLYRLLQKYPHEHQRANEKTTRLTLHNKELINSLILKGLVSGDKVKNQVDVPKWIKNCLGFIPRSLKGLFNTDGSVWVHFNHKSIYLSFRNASYPLVNDFKEMCERCDIKTQPKITKFHKINEETREDIYGYQVFISSKFYVKKFLKTVKPEKWKDRNRRKYLGTILILLNNEKSIKDKIFSQIERDFPKESDRRYSIEYTNYLSNLCVKHGCVINNNQLKKL